MDKLVMVLFGLCMLPALSSAEFLAKFEVSGRVYCDTCRAGYETVATPSIAGAKVKIECKEREHDMNVKYVAGAVTNSTGWYNILVEGDRGDEVCDVKLVSSPHWDCSEADPGRSVSRVILTRSNGLCTETRFANALGFFRYEPMAGCTKIRKKYEEDEDDE